MSTAFVGDSVMTIAQSQRRRPSSWQSLLLASLTLGCIGDQCVNIVDCPVGEAAEISVSSPGAPTGIPGLMVSRNGLPPLPCDQAIGGVSICQVPGGYLGAYVVELLAVGYQTDTLKFTATGDPGGCNKCGLVDLQFFSVVLHPTN